MVLMTDGIHNTGPEPILSARVAAQNDIVIHTVTFSDDADIGACRTWPRRPAASISTRTIKPSWSISSSEIAATLPVMLTE